MMAIYKILLLTVFFTMISRAVGDKINTLNLLGVGSKGLNCRPGFNGPNCQNLALAGPNYNPLSSNGLTYNGLYANNNNYNDLGYNYPAYNSIGSGGPNFGPSIPKQPGSLSAGLVSSPGVVSITKFGFRGISSPSTASLNGTNINGIRPGISGIRGPGIGDIRGPSFRSPYTNSIGGKPIRGAGIGGIPGKGLSSISGQGIRIISPSGSPKEPMGSLGEPSYGNYGAPGYDTSGLGSYGAPELNRGPAFKDFEDLDGFGL